MGARWTCSIFEFHLFQRCGGHSCCLVTTVFIFLPNVPIVPHQQGSIIQRCKERTCWRDNSMYKFRHSTFPQVASVARPFLGLAPLHEGVAASIRPSVAAAAVSGTSVRCSRRNFGTSIISAMLSFQVGRLSCTSDQSNFEVFLSVFVP